MSPIAGNHHHKTPPSKRRHGDDKHSTIICSPSQSVDADATNDDDDDVAWHPKTNKNPADAKRDCPEKDDTQTTNKKRREIIHTKNEPL